MPTRRSKYVINPRMNGLNEPRVAFGEVVPNGWRWELVMREVVSVPNEKNLIPNSERTPEELREITSKGGKASGAARRRKRSLKEAADLYLSMPVSDRRRWNVIARKGVEPEDIDNQMAMIIGLTEAATNGDAKAAKIIVDLIGDIVGADDAGVQIVDDL